MEDWLLSLGLSLVFALVFLYLIEMRRRTSGYTAEAVSAIQTKEPPFKPIANVQDDMLTAVGLATTHLPKPSIMDAPAPGAMKDWMDQQPRAPPVSYTAPAPAPSDGNLVQLQPGQTAALSQTLTTTPGQTVPTVTFQIPNSLALQIQSLQNEYVQQLGANQDTPDARQQFIAKKTAQVAADRKAMLDRAYQDWVAQNGPANTSDAIAKYTASVSALQQKFDLMDAALQTLSQTWVPAMSGTISVPTAPPLHAPAPNSKGPAPMAPSLSPALAAASGVTST